MAIDTIARNMGNPHANVQKTELKGNTLHITCDKDTRLMDLVEDFREALTAIGASVEVDDNLGSMKDDQKAFIRSGDQLLYSISQNGTGYIIRPSDNATQVQGLRTYHPMAVLHAYAKNLTDNKPALA